jgi:hypothetical protein
VVMDRRRRGEPDGLGDLAHRRRVTPLRDALPNEGEDSFRSLLVLLSHVSTIPNICSPVKTGPAGLEPTKPDKSSDQAHRKTCQHREGPHD